MEDYLAGLMRIIDAENVTPKAKIEAAELYLKAKVLQFIQSTSDRDQLGAAESLFGFTINEDCIDKLKQIKGK